MVGGQRSSGQLTLLLRSMISVLSDQKHKFRFVDPQNRPLCLLFESLILFTGLSKTLILGIQPPLIQNLIVAPGMHLSSHTSNHFILNQCYKYLHCFKLKTFSTAALAAVRRTLTTCCPCKELGQGMIAVLYQALLSWLVMGQL